jgi:hypothetical protein
MPSSLGVSEVNPYLNMDIKLHLKRISEIRDCCRESNIGILLKIATLSYLPFASCPP